MKRKPDLEYDALAVLVTSNENDQYVYTWLRSLASRRCMGGHVVSELSLKPDRHLMRRLGLTMQLGAETLQMCGNISTRKEGPTCRANRYLVSDDKLLRVVTEDSIHRLARVRIVQERRPTIGGHNDAIRRRHPHYQCHLTVRIELPNGGLSVRAAEGRGQEPTHFGTGHLPPVMRRPCCSDRLVAATVGVRCHHVLDERQHLRPASLVNARRAVTSTGLTWNLSDVITSLTVAMSPAYPAYAIALRARPELTRRPPSRNCTEIDERDGDRLRYG